MPPPGERAGRALRLPIQSQSSNMSGDGPLRSPRHGMGWQISRAAPGGSVLQQRQRKYLRFARWVLSGTGYFFSNTITGTGCNKMTSLDIARFIQTGRSVGHLQWDATVGLSPWSSSSACLDQPGSGAGVYLKTLRLSWSSAGNRLRPCRPVLAESVARPSLRSWRGVAEQCPRRNGRIRWLADSRTG